MRDSRTRACLLLLASAGLLPAEPLPEAPPGDVEEVETVRMSRRDRIEKALATARRRLELEKFLFDRLRNVRDPGISPSYLQELEAARKRVLDAKAMKIALEMLLTELRKMPQI